MKINALPSQSFLTEWLDYDPATGIFRWKKTANNNGARRGDVAGTDNGNGYVRIVLQGVRYYAHRLAWMIVYGGDPMIEVDHENRVRDDNRIENLRPAGMSRNLGNIALPSHNTSGRKGVCWDKSRNKWIVHIKVNGVQKYLGRFADREEAARAYDRAAVAHFGPAFALTNERMAA